MVPGFNTDFRYRGETYHVQTEDNGVNNPVVVTLLYFKGAILASRRTPYRDLLAKPGYQKDLMELMKSQHKALMRELLSGALDGGAGAGAGAPAAAPQQTAPAPAPAVAAAAPVVAAPPPPPAAAAPRREPPSLDALIWAYLQEHAAAVH